MFPDEFTGGKFLRCDHGSNPDLSLFQNYPTQLCDMLKGDKMFHLGFPFLYIHEKIGTAGQQPGIIQFTQKFEGLRLGMRRMQMYIQGGHCLKWTLFLKDPEPALLPGRCLRPYQGRRSGRHGLPSGWQTP